MNTELNIDELKSTVKYIISNNNYIQEQGKTPVAINVESPAGIGKTSSILQIAQELGMDLVKLSLAEIEEIGDLVGFPIKQYEVKKDDGTIKWVSENLLPLYLQNKWVVSGHSKMSYAPPAWIHGKTKPMILLLDDYSRGDHRFMQATMSIIDRQEYISWSLPKGSLVILSSNPDNGNYFVTTLDNAQKTRFITFSLKFDIDCWGRYAENIKIDSRCINFLLMHPELVTENINPRCVTTFFNSISSIQNFDKELPMIQLVGEASVGPEFSTMFTMFINNKLDKLIHPKEILTAEKWETVCKKLLETIGRDNEYRADIASVIATRIINYTLMFSSTEVVTQKIIDRIIEISTTEELFTTDLRYYIIKAIVNGDKQKFNKLMMNSKIVEMSIR